MSTAEFNAGESSALLLRARAGDEHAYTSLIRRYQGCLFGVVSRLLQPAGRGYLVEDLVQETFIRAFQALERFDPSRGTKFSTWLITIAVRLGLDELRRSRTKLQHSPDYLEFVADPQSRCDAALKRQRIGTAIENAVSSLSDSHRAVFILRDIQDLSYQEISEALDLDIGTVKSRLFRARAELRRVLGTVENV